MNIIYKSLLLLSVTTVIYSCKSEVDVNRVTDSSQQNDDISSVDKEREIVQNLVDNNISNSYEAKNGILHFKDLSSFRSVMNSLNNLPIQKRIAKTDIPGFKSLLSCYDDYLKEFKDETKKPNLESYNDIISLSVEKKQKYIYTDFVKSALLNRQGLVYIGKILYKFTDDQQQVVVDGDLKKLGKKDQMVMTYSDPTTPVSNARQSATCNGFDDGSQNADNTRQIHLKIYMAKSYYLTSGTTGDVDMKGYAYGEPTKRGGWFDGYSNVRYTTDNTLYSEWTFTVKFNDTQETKTASDSYLNQNYYDYIDFSGTTLTFHNIPNAQYNVRFSPQFSFGPGYYYTTGVPPQYKIETKCP